MKNLGELIKGILYNLTTQTESDGFSLNTFAIIKDSNVLLVDGILPIAFQGIDELLAMNPDLKIVGSIVSHHHVPMIAKKQGLELFFKKFGNVELILPDYESGHIDATSALPLGRKYTDPNRSKYIKEFDISVCMFSGHTEHHPIYYWKPMQLLIAGDCAVGPTSKNKWYSRPPFDFSWDDNRLKESWDQFLTNNTISISTLCTFHGGTVVQQTDEQVKRLLQPLRL
jgi:glyoxylase-like metal-dependent hydrolase (beta-lactamase superfamily II)